MAFPFLADRVRETSTTTGTGTFTTSASAVSGFQAFAGAGADGQTVDYTIEGIDGAGALTGEWEVGQGVYTAAGSTLTRVTVYASSNAGALVNFSAGTKLVTLTIAAAHLGAPTNSDVVAAIATDPAAVRDALGEREYPPRAALPSGYGRLPFAGTIQSNGSLTPTADRIYAAIGYVAAPLTITVPQIWVTTGQTGATCRIGIAEFDSTNLVTPTGTLLVDFGTADCSVNNSSPSFSNGTATVTLQPGTLYCVLFIAGGSATVPTFKLVAQESIGVQFVRPITNNFNFVSAFTLTGQGSQRTGGFATTPIASASAAILNSTSGFYNFAVFSEVP